MYKKNQSILKLDFFNKDTSELAKNLLGKILVKKYGDIRLSGVIVETEAYYGSNDPASHAFRGRTKRSSIMFGRAGIAYIYLCYGMYYMLNSVSEEEGMPGAVLIRSVVPLAGIEIMQERRGTVYNKNLANGPGKLTEAFGITSKDNGKDFADPGCDLNIYHPGFLLDPEEIFVSPRIGINSAREALLRFYIDPQRFWAN